MLELLCVAKTIHCSFRQKKKRIRKNPILIKNKTNRQNARENIEVIYCCLSSSIFAVAIGIAIAIGIGIGIAGVKGHRGYVNAV